MKRILLFGLLLGIAMAQPGTQLFQKNCVFCHGDNGQGRIGAFPPLAGHAVDIVKVSGGREHLISVLLYGLQGQIKVKADSFNGVMPAFAHLTDEQVANVLNQVLTAWGNDKLLPRDHKPIAPAEVAAARSNKLTAQQVWSNRSKLNVP